MEVERSIQNIWLTYDQLLVLIQKSFPNCTKFDNWELLSGGALNTTYKFQIANAAFVLRIYARDRAHCKTEKAIHEFIDQSVSTPKLIYANEFHEPWAYSIFEFIPGKLISDVSINDKNSLSYKLGYLLSSIHKFKLTQAGLFGEGISIGRSFERGSSPYYEEALSILSKGVYARSRLGSKLSEKTLAFIQKYQNFFPIIDDNVCLTHSDFKPVNLLYSDGKVFALDWEFAHAGIGILDFAILLRHREEFPFDINSLASGYTDYGGCLGKEWIRSALITDFVNIMQLLEAPSERPRLFHQLRNAIQSTINNWESSHLI